MASNSLSAPNYGGVNHQPPEYAQDGDEHAPLLNNTPKPTAGKFTPAPRYNDVWATFAYGLNMVAFAGLNFYSIRHYSADAGLADDGLVVVDHSLAMLILSSLFVTFGLSLGYYGLVQRKTEAMVKISFIFTALLSIALGVVQLLSGHWFFGGIQLFAGTVVLFCYKYWAPNMRISVLFLQTAAVVTKKYPAVLAVAVSGLFVQVLWSTLWLFSLAINMSVFQRISKCRLEGPEDQQKLVCDNNWIFVVQVYMFFVMFWTSQILKNVVHVTVAGVFGTHYFFEGSAQGAPSSPTLSSARRALTTSFGSISFGSLLIALLQTLRFVLNSLRSESDDGLRQFLAMCANCLLSMLEGLFELFNKYAFTQVAIYGKDFITAAKDTLDLFKDRGIEALINDSLVGNVLFMGSFSVAVLSGLYGYLFVAIVQPSILAQGEMEVTIAVVVIEILLAFAMTSVVNNVFDSGICATFVALAESPEILEDNNPVLYNAILQDYPEARIRVNHSRA